MGGLFGTVSETNCIEDLFYGTDYHFHLGTKRGGLAIKNVKGYKRVIHNIENAYFRSKFEPDLSDLHGRMGVGALSDTDDQPLIIGSHLGRFAIVTVSQIKNMEQLAQKAFSKKIHFSEASGGDLNPTELIATLICEGTSFADGIQRAQEVIQGSCSLLLLTDPGIYAARDKLGRTPVIIGKKEGAFAVTSETCAFPNLGYEVEQYLGP